MGRQEGFSLHPWHASPSCVRIGVTQSRLERIILNLSGAFLRSSLSNCVLSTFGHSIASVHMKACASMRVHKINLWDWSLLSRVQADCLISSSWELSLMVSGRVPLSSQLLDRSKLGTGSGLVCSSNLNYWMETSILLFVDWCWPHKIPEWLKCQWHFIFIAWMGKTHNGW